MSSDIAMFDAAALHQPLLAELDAAMATVLRHGRFIQGPEVNELEERLADYVGLPYCITCASGTTALVMALMALGVGPGDEVILPALTFAAPIEAVLLLGAMPVLADIEPGTHTLSTPAVDAVISTRTRAVIAVSLYGQPADFTGLSALAREHGIALIEDGAQSFGGELDGVRSGAFGDVSCTSFFPSKPLGGCGDGGALFTRHEPTAIALRQIRDHGQSGKYQHVRLGFNGRLDTLACAALLVKLRHFPVHLQRRRALATRYDRGLAAFEIPVLRAGAVSAYAQYCIQLDDRGAVHDFLAQAGIATAVHYPSTLDQQSAFRPRLRMPAPIAHAQRLARRGLCLPLHAAMTEAQQDRVIEALARAPG